MSDDKAAVRPSRGVIYLAAGGKSYMGELLESLASLRRHEPDLPVTVFSRFRTPRRVRCHRVDFRSQEHPLKQKVIVLKDSPYDQTLFLDTDTTVLGRLTPIFDYLQHFDFSVGNMYVCDWESRPPRLISMVKPDDYNTGVLLYNKTPAALRFLDWWEDAVRAQDAADMWAGHNCDQDHFNRILREGAVHATGVRFGAFPNTIYNVRGIMVPELQRLGQWEAARILHHRTRAMKVRKALYSFTDWHTAREVAMKVAGRVGEMLRPARSRA